MSFRTHGPQPSSCGIGQSLPVPVRASDLHRCGDVVSVGTGLSLPVREHLGPRWVHGAWVAQSWTEGLGCRQRGSPACYRNPNILCLGLSGEVWHLQDVGATVSNWRPPLQAKCRDPTRLPGDLPGARPEKR
jgi:hypothetical protein